MAANKFVLKGSGVEMDYTIGVTPGIPALVYRAGAFQKSFTSSQILSNDTGLGELVSVALILEGATVRAARPHHGQVEKLRRGEARAPA